MSCRNNGDTPWDIKDESVDQEESPRQTDPAGFLEQGPLKPRYRKYEEGDQRDEQESISQFCVNISFILNLTFLKTPFNQHLQFLSPILI
jgi:hypothetical protein